MPKETPHTNSVRQASMVARAAPLRFLVTLMPKKLKKAMDRMLASVDHCSWRDPWSSCRAAVVTQSSSSRMAKRAQDGSHGLVCHSRC